MIRTNRTRRLVVMLASRCGVRSAFGGLRAIRALSTANPVVNDFTLRPTSRPGTVGGVLDAQVTKNHMKRAVEVLEKPTLKWSYGQLKYNADGLAAGLLQYGFRAGDKIAMSLADDAEKVVFLLATAKAGLTVIPLPTAPSTEQLKNALAKGVRGVVITDTVGNTSYVQEMYALVPEILEASAESDSGIPFKSTQYPNLRYVFNTGRSRAAGMTRLDWVPSYTADTDLAHTVADVSPNTPYLMDPVTGKVMTHAAVVDLAKRAFAPALPSNSIVAVASSLDSPSAIAAGTVAVQLNGALGLYSADAFALDTMMTRSVQAFVAASKDGSRLADCKEPLTAAVLVGGSAADASAVKNCKSVVSM